MVVLVKTFVTLVLILILSAVTEYHFPTDEECTMHWSMVATFAGMKDGRSHPSMWVMATLFTHRGNINSQPRTMVKIAGVIFGTF